MEDDPILVEERSGVAWVTLNRPRVRNAVSLRMRLDLAAAVEELATRPGLHALVLTGAGPSFCAGGDVAELAIPRSAAQSRERVEAGNRMIRALYGFPVPTIAAVQGAAAGAGCSLALACDLVVAAESARFRLSFVGMGLGPDAGASWLLPSRLGYGRARELVFLGGVLPAPRAHVEGLVDRLVPDDRLVVEVTELAGVLAATSRPALVESKRLLASVGEFDAALAAELEAQVRLLETPEHHTACAEFLRRNEEIVP